MAQPKYYAITYSVLLDPDDVERAKRIWSGVEEDNEEFAEELDLTVRDAIRSVSHAIGDVAAAVPEDTD